MVVKKIFLGIAIFAFAVNVGAQSIAQYYDQYVMLYPNCVDDEFSKIYPWEEPYLTQPEFPGGGPVQMSRYVHFSTVIPDVKDAGGKQLKGKVLIKAYIDRCGVLKSPEIIQSLSNEHDSEALRVVESFPVFKPGALDGERVKVAIIIPVYFTRTYVPKQQTPTFDDDYWDNFDNYGW